MKLTMHLTRVLGLAAASIFSAQSYAAEVRASDVDIQAAPHAFSQNDLGAVFESTKGTMQLASLSSDEMKATEGAVAPLVAMGVMAGGRFIVQRWVTQRAAQAMVARGTTNIMAPTRSIAQNIAGRNPIREFHYKPGQPGNFYSHFHPAGRPNQSHIWYGRPR